MQSSFKYLVVLFILILLSQPIFAQDSAEVTVVWNQDILVVINTNGVAVNVSDLDFVSANGEIMAGDWAMDTYGDLNFSYSLANFEPGSCLVAYPGDAEEQPDLPETVECTTIVGTFTMTNFDDIVWSAEQGGFSADVAGATVTSCDITGSSCTASVATTASNSVDATESEEDDSEADILVAWNTDIFTIINTSDEEVNLSALTFRSSLGTISPENWVMGITDVNNLPYELIDVEPGSCLVAYLSADEEPEFPEDVECAQTEGMFTMANINDMVWDASHGGFSAEIGGTAISDCDINNTTCILTVPTTSDDDEMESMEMTPSVRAVWNTDIMVVVNTSGEEADLSGLSFTSSLGTIAPENWVMGTNSADNNLSYSLSDVAPGACLVAYLSADEQPELPENVTCTETEGMFTMTNINDMVWDASHGGFSATMGGATVADCDINASSCEIELGS